MKKLLLLLLCVPLIGFGQCSSGDCNNGYGTYIWDNGDVYLGEWKKDKKHGQGTMTLVHKGQWENDKFLGN